MINDLLPTLLITDKPANSCGDTMGGVVGAGLIKHGDNVEQFLFIDMTNLMFGNEIGKKIFLRFFHCIVYAVLDVGKQFIIGSNDTRVYLGSLLKIFRIRSDRLATQGASLSGAPNQRQNRLAGTKKCETMEQIGFFVRIYFLQKILDSVAGSWGVVFL